MQCVAVHHSFMRGKQQRKRPSCYMTSASQQKNYHVTGILDMPASALSRRGGELKAAPTHGQGLSALLYSEVQ